MTTKKTTPSFIEGWEKIPGASNYEINAQAEARNFQTKKLIGSLPDAEGCVQIYGDEKKLQKFNLRKIADELFPAKESSEEIKIENNEVVIPSDQIITPETTETNNPQKSTKMPSKKAAIKAPIPKKVQSPKKTTKRPETKPGGHAKGKSSAKPKPENKSIKEKAEILKKGVIDESKLKGYKTAIDEIMAADTFGHEKIYKLHKMGLSTPEISKVTGKRKEVVQRDIWLYTSGKKK